MSQVPSVVLTVPPTVEVRGFWGLSPRGWGDGHSVHLILFVSFSLSRSPFILEFDPTAVYARSHWVYAAVRQVVQGTLLLVASCARIFCVGFTRPSRASCFNRVGAQHAA